MQAHLLNKVKGSRGLAKFIIDNHIRTVFNCMGKSIRIQRVKFHIYTSHVV